MWKKIKEWLFTFNLTMLLTLNLFFILLTVLGFTAAAAWVAMQFHWIQLDELLRPDAVMIVIYVAAILIGISMVVMIRKVILNPVRGMVRAMQQLAGGDFSVRMACSGWMRPLELREFTTAFNKAAEELGGTEILRKDFINNFSHEFKTPITSIGGFADLLLEDEEMPREEQREYLNIITSESKRLAALANSVLALSRVEAQTILTDTTPFPLAEQLRQSTLLVEKKWRPKKEVTIEVLIPESDECIYIGNEGLLKEVWVNLLDNAAKFSSEGGIVTLSLRKTSDGMTVAVTDRGPGMDQVTQGHIFDRFYQGDTSHKTEGNGLGLALVHRIVTLHGGTVTVQSALGQGSCFQVNLPSQKS